MELKEKITLDMLTKDSVSDEYYNAVMAVWGDNPTVDEPIESEVE